MMVVQIHFDRITHTRVRRHSITIYTVYRNAELLIMGIRFVYLYGAAILNYLVSATNFTDNRNRKIVEQFSQPSPCNFLFTGGRRIMSASLTNILGKLATSPVPMSMNRNTFYIKKYYAKLV